MNRPSQIGKGGFFVLYIAMKIVQRLAVHIEEIDRIAVKPAVGVGVLRNYVNHIPGGDCGGIKVESLSEGGIHRGKSGPAGEVLHVKEKLGAVFVRHSLEAGILGKVCRGEAGVVIHTIVGEVLKAAGTVKLPAVPWGQGVQYPILPDAGGEKGQCQKKQ